MSILLCVSLLTWQPPLEKCVSSADDEGGHDDGHDDPDDSENSYDHDVENDHDVDDEHVDVDVVDDDHHHVGDDGGDADDDDNDDDDDDDDDIADDTNVWKVTTVASLSDAPHHVYAMWGPQDWVFVCWFLNIKPPDGCVYGGFICRWMCL